MVAVSEYSYNEINIKLSGDNSCEKICKHINSLLNTIPKDKNLDHLFLNIGIRKIAHTVDDNIKKIDNSR